MRMLEFYIDTEKPTNCYVRKEYKLILAVGYCITEKIHLRLREKEREM